MKTTVYNLNALESTQVKSIVPELLNDNDQIVEISENPC